MAAARFTFSYYRRDTVAIFYFPSRHGSGRSSAVMNISDTWTSMIIYFI
jgi:hypothetical protein